MSDRSPAPARTVAQSRAVVRRVRPAGPRVGGAGGQGGAGQVVRLVLEVPAQAGIAAAARPGHFAALAAGGPLAPAILRRAFSIHGVRSARELAGGEDSPSVLDAWADPARSPVDQLDLAVTAEGADAGWLSQIREGDELDLVAPLGRPFPLPQQPVSCVLVGEGGGAAALLWLAQALRARGCQVDLVLGAATSTGLYGLELAREVAESVVVTTQDGSVGVPGRVSDVLPEVLGASGAAVVYAAGPMEMLRTVTAQAAARGAIAQVAVGATMPCGIGVCQTCVLPVVRADGATSMVRSCVEGPVFRGERICWDAIADDHCRVPTDVLDAGGEG